MKFTLVVLSLTLLAIAGPVARGSDQPEVAAQPAAASWLALVDAGNYSASWAAASSLFRQHVSQSEWQSSAAAARAPFGGLKSRKLQSATYTHSLPGAPEGEYVVITYESSFEHKVSATETITPMKESDGNWRVSGYYIR